MSSLVPTINLPFPILIHAVGLVALGFHITFRRPDRPESTPSSSSATLGITTIGIGLGYLATSYVPVAENQWLHASVPVRILLGAVAGVRALLAKEGEFTGELVVIMLYDGLGGLLLGWLLGRWDGKVASY